MKYTWNGKLVLSKNLITKNHLKIPNAINIYIFKANSFKAPSELQIFTTGATT